jgi:hypothetical protein
MIADVERESYSDVLMQINELTQYAKRQDTINAVRRMKRMVPSYKSKNSVFEKLDIQ